MSASVPAKRLTWQRTDRPVPEQDALSGVEQLLAHVADGACNLWTIDFS
jgi:hypothetical protein